MPLIAHLDELGAINEMLLSVGEAPVSSLVSNLPDADVALAVLGRVSRAVQLRGWHVNRHENVKLSRDSLNIISLGVVTLKVDTVGTDRSVNAVMRRSTDKTQFLLFDIEENRETWPDKSELTVTWIEFMDFDNLTPSLQAYIAARAGREFQKGVMGSQVLHEFTKEAIQDALDAALQEDMENEDTNILQQNTRVFSMINRRNRGIGR